MRSVKDRFIQYIKIDTQSDPTTGTSPSTKKQFDLAKVLYQEMIDLGMEEVSMDEEHCFVYGSIPSNLPEGKNAPVLGFASHMDTAPAFSGTNVNPQFVENYDGQPIPYVNAPGYFLSPKDSPELLNYVGKTLITSDGTTLLGCDDKGGIAEIMTAVEELLAHPEIPHGKIIVCFTRDEEIGCGVQHIDLNCFHPDFGYTIDGGEIGEIEYENFNAAGATITCYGKSYHPGDSKNKMVNAILIANELISLLPAEQTPSHTEGYEGFFHVNNLSGDVEETKMHIIIRDHDKEKFLAKKAFMESCVNFLNGRYGAGTVALDMKDSYYNMRELVEPVIHLIDNAKKAMEMEGVVPKVIPIRGGTDGANLSYMGIPCPNLSTGGHNFHGRFEYVCLESMESMVNVIKNIVTLYAE